MKLKTTALLLVISALLFGGCAKQSSQMDYIGTEEAKTLALQASGLPAGDVKFTEPALENKNGLAYYRVDFEADGQDYAYDIDAMTGRVLETRGPSGREEPSAAGSDGMPAAAVPQSAQTPQPSQPSQPAETEKPLLTADAAGEKALAHAGLTGRQVTFVTGQLEWENGRQIYEVEFYTDDYTEYDYEIDAYTGEVISYDYDAEGCAPPETGVSITADRAKEIALSQVPGASMGDIWEFESDADDGRLEYEGKIIYDGREYAFTIDGYSGAIREWSAESIDD